MVRSVKTAFRSVFRAIFRAVAVGLVLVLVGYLGISWRYADGVTRVTRDPFVKTAEYVAPTHENVSFRNDAGLLLQGWWFTAPKPRGRAAVEVHGKDQNRIDSSFDPGRQARFLLANGYSVLLFDLQGHGTSEGLRWGLGQYEADDIVAAVKFAAAKAGIAKDRVATIGESMGGGSVLMAVGRDPGIGPTVVDSAYASAPVVVGEIGPKYSHLPAFFTPGLVLMAKLLYARDVASVVPVDIVRAHPERAFLFIQCENDDTVNPHHARDLRAASANPASELWMVADCGHVKAFITHPQEWQDHVLAFLEARLGP